MKLEVSKIVFSLLQGATALQGIKISPIVVERTTKKPFIIFKRTNQTDKSSKDLTYQDESTVTVKVVSDNYSQSITIAKDVESALEVKNKTVAGFSVASISLEDADEDYVEDAAAFVQTLNFKIVINNG